MYSVHAVNCKFRPCRSIHQINISGLAAQEERCREGGGLANERGEDARHLTWGCKFRILVSPGVFWSKHHRVVVKISLRI